MITKVLEALHLRPNASKDSARVKVHVSANGSLRIKGRELAQSSTWRKEVDKLIDADLTGRNRQERND